MFAVGAYQAERLRPEQAPALQNLFNRCPDYFHLVEGHPAPPDAAEKEFSDRPANTAPEDCFLFGLRLPEKPLTGVLQAFRHYPAQNHWYIGLLLLDPAARCTGRGAACYQNFESWAATKGATKILIAVLTDNLRAHRFWQRQSFILPRCYRPMTFGARTHIPIEYEKPLPPGHATPSADAGGHHGQTAR